jgi:hypothetical protein
MRKVFSDAMTILLVAGLALATATHAAETTYHVSPTGKDSNPGTQAQPFATLTKARDAVRVLRQSATERDKAVTVVLHTGTYELAETLIFSPEDSGTETHPVRYVAQSNDTVTVSGGLKITNWNVSTNGGWTAELPEVKAGKWFFRQLSVNGRRAVRARWPNEDGILRVAAVSNAVTTFTFNQPLTGGNLGGQDAEMVAYNDWSVTRGIVVSSDKVSVTTATPMGWIGHGSTTVGPGRPVYFENAREFLDQPGEWFLDRAAGVLHYLPQKGETPGNTEIVAPRLERLIALTGTKDAPVRHLRFEGIRFQHADFLLPVFGYSEIQAAHYGTVRKAAPIHVQPVAVQSVWTEHCRFERCRFAHLNSSGLGFGAGCRSNLVDGCLIEDIGGNGVMIGWRGAGKLQTNQLDADWADPTDAPVGNAVSNCLIRRCGADSRGAVGVWVGFSSNTRIAHNLVCDLPYTGISVGYRWNTSPTTQQGSMIEYNHIHDVMQMLGDGGGIYTLGFQPGTVLRGNLIHAVHRSSFAIGSPNNGFFLDEGSKGFLLEKNRVFATSGAPVRFNANQREWHTWGDNELNTNKINYASGKIGRARWIHKGGDAIQEPHDVVLDPEKFTISAWIRSQEFRAATGPTDDNRRWVVSKNGNEWTQGHYGLVAKGRELMGYLNIGGGQTNSFSVITETAPLEAGRWQHIAMTYDGRQLRLYHDGRPVAATTVDKPRVAGNGGLVIGGRADGWGDLNFLGSIDEVRVYKAVLTPEQIAAEVSHVKSPLESALIKAWDFGVEPEPDPAQVSGPQPGPLPPYRKQLGLSATGLQTTNARQSR